MSEDRATRSPSFTVEINSEHLKSHRLVVEGFWTVEIVVRMFSVCLSCPHSSRHLECSIAEDVTGGCLDVAGNYWIGTAQFKVSKSRDIRIRTFTKELNRKTTSHVWL